MIEATARFIRRAGQAAARWGFSAAEEHRSLALFHKVTVAFLPIMVTSPLRTTTP